jgi:uncharacterized delta-60 repeat protein
MLLKTTSVWLFIFLLASLLSTFAYGATIARPGWAQSDLIWGWDATFGQGGVASFATGSGFADDITIQQTYRMPDGAILAGIQSWQYGKFSQSYFEIVRFTDDGSVADELLVYDDPTLELVGVQSDGRFILLQYGDYPYLTRFWSDLTQDTTFGSSGEARLPDGAYILSVQPDDKIIGGVREGNLFRLNPDGSTDSGFPTDFGPYFELSALVADGEGNLLIAAVDDSYNRCSAWVYSQDAVLLGTVYDTYSWQPDNFCFPGVFIPYPQGGFVWSWGGERIYKVNLNGSPDLSFGDGGTVELSQLLAEEVFPEFIYLAIGSEGQIYFTGSMNIDGAGHPLVGGFDQFGQPDPSFGPQGILHLNLVVDEVEAVFAVPDGKLLLAGFNDPNYLLMRLRQYSVSPQVYLPWVNR